MPVTHPKAVFQAQVSCDEFWESRLGDQLLEDVCCYVEPLPLLDRGKVWILVDLLVQELKAQVLDKSVCDGLVVFFKVCSMTDPLPHLFKG